MNIKKIAASFLAAVMLTGSAAVSVPASAAAVTDGILDEETNLFYEPLEDGTLCVTLLDFQHQPQGDVVIPETYDGKTVTGISKIITGCKNVPSITVPKTINNITLGALTNSCLEKIIVSDDNPNYSSEDGILFNKDKTEIVYYPMGKLDATNYTIPATVDVIGVSCFNSCKLESIIIPDSVRTIKSSAFGLCENLTSLNIPKSVETINAPLDNGSAVTEFNVDPDNKSFCSVDGVIFSKDRKTLISYPSSKETEEYTIPDGVEILGYESMSRNTNLKKVNIPESVHSMDNRVFYMDRNLLSVTVPSKVKVLTAAFNYCTSLESVTLPHGIEKITAGTFGDIQTLKIINYDGTKADWDMIEIESGRNLAMNDATIYFSDGTSMEGAGLTPKDTSIQEPVTITNNDDGSMAFTPGVEKFGAVSNANIETMKQIKATAPEGAFKGNVSMNVVNTPASLSGNTFSVDISFTKDGEKVQPEKELTIMIPVPAKLKKADPIFVYHIGAENKPEKVKAEITNIDGVPYVVFKANHFSTYALTDKEVEETTPTTPDDPAAPTTPSTPSEPAASDATNSDTSSEPESSTPDNSAGVSSGDNSNPSTGIALSVLPLVLAASAVIVIKKRK